MTVYPYPFDYVRPKTLEEALFLAQDDGMKFLAGGQSLLPLLNLHLAEIKGVIDLRHIAPSLKFFECEQEHIELGSCLTHEEVLHSEFLARRCPLFSQAAAFIGHPRIRRRGTLGGSIAHADPLAEWMLVMTLLDPQVILTSLKAVRPLSFHDYLLGPMMTALSPGELITAIELSLPKETTYGFAEMSRRQGDYALAAAGVSVQWDQNRILQANIAVSGVSDVPLVFPAIARNMSWEYPSRDLLEEIKQAIEASVDPPSDALADPSYLRHLAGILVERALCQAFDADLNAQR
jgi:CO/xanthine dehydrogenase FAD-binding subunit